MPSTCRPRQPRAATLNIDTRIRRQLTEGCEYEAHAVGSYRSADLTGTRADLPVRDVDVRGDASLTCNGNVVRRETHRFVFPRMVSRQHLADVLTARLGTQIPGSQCTWSARFDFEGGVLQANRVESDCPRGESVAALRGYLRPGVGAPAAVGGGPTRSQLRGELRPMRFVPRQPPTGSMPHSGQWWQQQRGGGPRDPVAEDARVGTH